MSTSPMMLIIFLFIVTTILSIAGIQYYGVGGGQDGKPAASAPVMRHEQRR